MQYYMGIDVGSLSTDGVLIDGDKNIIKSIILPTGASIKKTISRCRDELLLTDDGGKIEPVAVVATGYGRKRVEFADHILTEITAHALGARHLFPETRTVIDIGGQDTKVIYLDEKGRVADFAMNDKCAAGTGRFIEVMARILELDLEEMADIAINAGESVEITSTCTVFIESEIISLIADTHKIDSIASGVFRSIAGRIISMVSNVSGKSPFTFTGGVAKNRGMVDAIRKTLQGDIFVPDDPQVTGALGAAIFALIHVKG
ncbi:MAG: acyl-CoA dehydratase activase [Candidatus Eremiobacteraeota bacterium]|nr:acyl-CoA dehydratase activase [Candidatus Eremiobacteraeota bacterium]